MLNICEGSLFAEKNGGDVYAVEFRPDDQLRLRPVLWPSRVLPTLVPFYIHLVDFGDEVEAGVWFPLDPENVFVGKRPATFEDVRRQVELCCLADAAIEKEVSHV